MKDLPSDLIEIIDAWAQSSEEVKAATSTFVKVSATTEKSGKTQYRQD